jgi:hypothetical protein
MLLQSRGASLHAARVHRRTETLHPPRGQPAPAPSPAARAVQAGAPQRPDHCRTTSYLPGTPQLMALLGPPAPHRHDAAFAWTVQRFCALYLVWGVPLLPEFMHCDLDLAFLSSCVVGTSLFCPFYKASNCVWITFDLLDLLFRGTLYRIRSSFSALLCAAAFSNF